MIIYADELFLKNVVISYLILIIVGEILSKKYRKRDLILSSIISSIITIVAVILEMDNNIITRIVIIYLTAIIGYRIKNPLIESTFILVITFLIGGITNSKITNFYEIIIFGVISIIAIKKYNDYYKKKKWKIRNKYKLQFEIENKIIELNAFLDTGNFLATNLKNEPVIVISKESIKNKVSNQIIDLLEKGEISDLKFNILKNIRSISYEVLNQDTKLMYGLKIKNIKILSEKNIIVRDAVIVLSKNKINESEAIIGIGLLEGGFEIGDFIYVKTKSEEIIC